MTNPPVQPPAGWYPDIQVAGGERWWDGARWTDYRRVAGGAAVPAATTATATAYAAPQAAPVQPVYQPTRSGGPVPLSAPLYGATMGEAWHRFWKKYTDFTGRASRSEYWFSYLWAMILMFGSYLVLGVFMGIMAGLASNAGRGSGAGFGIVAGILGLLLLAAWVLVMIPLIAVGVRRLHDVGYPGTYYFFGLIPFAGGIILLVLLLTESRPSGAIYDRPTT